MSVANMGTGRTGAVPEVSMSQDGGLGQGVDSCGGNEGWISQMLEVTSTEIAANRLGLGCEREREELDMKSMFFS